MHRQEHDGLRGPGGRDHRHPAHHPVQRKEGRQLLHTAQGGVFTFYALDGDLSQSSYVCGRKSLPCSFSLYTIYTI